jgi:hypothetical protein
LQLELQIFSKGVAIENFFTYKWICKRYFQLQLFFLCNCK